MRTISKIIVHCADTYIDMDTDVDEIRRWHVEGNGWDDIGYHWVIKRDGTIQAGRPEHISGAHTKGHNNDSIGICLVGGKGADDKPEANFTLSQYQALAGLVLSRRQEYGNLFLFGHRDFADKACPSFNVQTLLGER